MRFPRHLKNEKGQAIVEFSLVAVFLVLLVIAFIELIFLVYTYIMLADSAKEGVRYAIVHGNENATPSGPIGPGAVAAPNAPCTTDSGNVTAVKTAVTNYSGSSGHAIATGNIKVCYSDGDNLPTHRVTVAVTYPYQAFFGLGWPTVNVHAEAEGRIVF
ncbi:MAG: TadE/TadG family type IV pilus assembly protein [Terriglobales bacterium]